MKNKLEVTTFIPNEERDDEPIERIFLNGQEIVGFRNLSVNMSNNVLMAYVGFPIDGIFKREEHK